MTPRAEFSSARKYDPTQSPLPSPFPQSSLFLEMPTLVRQAIVFTIWGGGGGVPPPFSVLNTLIPARIVSSVVSFTVFFPFL